jgi:hypothetical protein
MNNTVKATLALCSSLVLLSCHEASTSNEAAKAKIEATAPDTATALSPSIRRTGVMDSLGVCYELVSDKTPQAFIQRQRLPFKLNTDTVSYDERGLYLGPKATIGSSKIQWDDQNRVCRLFVDDSRIALNYGIRVGMDKQQLMHLLGAKDNKDSFDTLSVDCGFLDNGCDFVFKRDKLVSISLTNEAD